jgi:hypothetical protein
MITLLTFVAGHSVLAAGDPVTDKLTAGHPEVAALLREHPQIVTILHDPMWTDVVLHAPLLPGTSWQVHDLRRPQPPIVAPDPRSCAFSAAPPSDAVAIFDGTGKDGFREDHPGLWRVEDGDLVASGSEGDHLATRQSFGDVQVHLEFATPNPPIGDWQFRGNSGVFMMGLYEIQILDSYRNPTYADGQSGALYGQVPPLVNASQPPGVWQCFDIVFGAPRFGLHGLVRPARVTLLYNGILVQSHAVFRGPTRFAEVTTYQAHAAELPFALQDHGDPGGRVRFRNIWTRRLRAEEVQNVAR